MLPGSALEIESEQVKALGRAVVAAKVDPFLADGIVIAAAFPTKRGGRAVGSGALLDPIIFGVVRVVGPRQEKE